MRDMRAAQNLPPPRAGEGRGGGLQRLLMATAAALIGLLAVLPVLPQLGHGFWWLWALYAILLLIPFALLVPVVIRPRSVVAAVAASLAVGLLLIWGFAAPPLSWTRLVMHLAAILSLAALVIQVIRGIGDRRYRVLWIVAGLLLSLPLGYLAAGLIGLHIVTQFCGGEILSILCSG
jgi:hypothetical protein